MQFNDQDVSSVGLDLETNATNAIGSLLGSLRATWPSLNKTTDVVRHTTIRMNVNQITYSILISLLLVADMFLIWSLGYTVLYFERRGRLLLRYYNSLKRQKRREEMASGESNSTIATFATIASPSAVFASKSNLSSKSSSHLRMKQT